MLFEGPTSLQSAAQAARRRRAGLYSGPSMQCTGQIRSRHISSRKALGALATESTMRPGGHILYFEDPED